MPASARSAWTHVPVTRKSTLEHVRERAWLQHESITPGNLPNQPGSEPPVKASALIFRFRYPLHALVYTLGFWAPWTRLLHLDPPGANAHVWGMLAVNLTQAGVSSLPAAFNILLIAGIVFATAGALLRTWASAYIGAATVNSPNLLTFPGAHDGVLRDGPFGYLRNPLYLGTLLHTFALALLMPRSGAIFTILAIALLQIRLVLDEEAFLTSKIGMPYTGYCALVRRFLPSFRRKVAPVGVTPHWGQAFAGEIYFWGVAVAFAFGGWRYNATLLIQCVIVSVGVALVLKALAPKA